LKKIREYYEREALLFKNHQRQMYFGDLWSKYWHRTRLSQILKMAKTVAFKSFLDIGCAEGYYLKFMPSNQGSKGYRVGLDIAKNYLLKAKKEAPEALRVLGDAQELPFRNHSFDLVLCTEVLEHLSNPKKAFVEAARVARKSVLVSVAGENLFYFFAKVLGLVKPDDPYAILGHGHIREMKLSEIMFHWAPSAGCKPVKNVVTCYFPVSFLRKHRMPRFFVPIFKTIDQILGKLSVIRDFGAVQIGLLEKKVSQALFTP